MPINRVTVATHAARERSNAIVGVQAVLFASKTPSVVNTSNVTELLDSGPATSASWSSASVRPGRITCRLTIANGGILVDLEQEFQAFKSHVNQHLATTTTPQQPQSPESHTTAEAGPADHASETIAIGNPFGRPSLETYRNYCRIWFDRYHSWFPILHQPTILRLCEDDSSQPRSPASLILDAIAVVIISTQQAPVDTSLDRDQFCRYLTDEIILAAIHDMSFRKLQALLILTMAEYGSGRMIDFWNLISLCKRYVLW